MKYSIIIPTYNHCDDLLRPCMESLFKYTDMTDVELIVSANGCTDNTREYLNSLKSQFAGLGFEKHLKVVWHDAPLGYSRANNVALPLATAEKVVLLNNDCVLLEQEKSQWLHMLDSAFAQPNCGISCVIKSHSEPANREFAIFFCVMIHRRVFNAVGPLNEEYGAGGGEDTEFCIEAEKAGFRVIQCRPNLWGGGQFVGEFPIYHKGEGTVHDPNCVPDWGDVFERNSLKLAQKYNPAYYQKRSDNRVKDSLRWLSENGSEAAELFKEVVVDNVYQVSEDLIKGRPVIDIGANVGMFSILAAKLGASKVVAVEPVAETFNALTRNLEQAQVATVVTPTCAVVLDENGKTVSIGLNEKSGHNSLYKSAGGTQQVSSVTLRSLLDAVGGDEVFVKMDCEGSEYDILMNAHPDDMRRVSRLAIEIHGDLHPKYRGVELIHERLKSFGMRLVDRKQICAWDWDAQGNVVNYRELPLTNEIWSR